MTSNHAPFDSAEVASFWSSIASSLSQLVGILDGLTDDERRWHPPAPDTNSLNVLAVHTLGNVEENVLETLCGTPVHRKRDEEFRSDDMSAEAIQTRWMSLREQVETALAGLTSSDLGRSHPHPRRGELTGREVLLLVDRHAAEHLGHAELTRDLLLAARQPSGSS